MKGTFRMISCSVVCSNIYRKARSCFRFLRSTRRFNQQTYPWGTLSRAKRKKLHLASDDRDRTIFALILTLKISRDQITSPENISTINNIVNGPLTQTIVYSLPMSKHFLLRTSTRSPTCKTTHRTPVCSIERSQTILIISNVF